MYILKVRLVAYREKSGDAPIPVPAMDYIVAILKRMRFGEVTLVAQDGKLVQIEHTEKVRVRPWQGDDKFSTDWEDKREHNIRENVEREFADLSFGRLSVVVQNGNIKQMSRLSMQRFMDGEGI